MELKKILNVDAKDVYDSIITSIKYDIEQATGKEISKEDIYEGYSYIKEMTTKTSNKGNITVTIEELKEPLVYACRFTSRQGDNYIKYEINSLEEGMCEVTYSEDFDGSSKSKNWNYKLVMLFYKRSFNKKANALLGNIEKYISNLGVSEE